jgi:hypothetical protein
MTVYIKLLWLILKVLSRMQKNFQEFFRSGKMFDLKVFSIMWFEI